MEEKAEGGMEKIETKISPRRDTKKREERLMDYPFRQNVNSFVDCRDMPPLPARSLRSHLDFLN